jgi:hypothetical protein
MFQMPALLPNDWEQLYPRHTPDRFTPEDGSRPSCCNIALYFCIIIIIIMGIQPLGRFGRNQSPVRQTVWLWYAASWASS